MRKSAAQRIQDRDDELEDERIIELLGSDARRTFDDEYGRHALVYPPGRDDRDALPRFGRVDVLNHISAIGVLLHPTRAAGHTPTHAAVEAAQ